MVAIGSYYDTSKDAKQYSLALLEIATKILRRRPSSASKKPRIVDLQTVVLLEILSTFCARQISVQMSGKFRSLFANLNQSTTTSPLAVFRTLKHDRSASRLADAQKFWIEIETRNRIFHACSVLDSQQTILFEQSPTVRRHPNVRVNVTHTKQMNLPCDDDLWDASSVTRWAEIAEKHDYIQLIGGRPVIAPGNRRSDYSYFQQQVINAHSEGVLKCEPSYKTISVGTDGRVSKSEFDYHAAWMCKHTPVQNLLLVTGESWLLGRKAEKAADYKKAKLELRKWVQGSATGKNAASDSSAAHWHALKLLRILQIHGPNRGSGEDIFGTTNMLHENWVVYLAALVCWACGQRKDGHGGSETSPTRNGVAHATAGGVVVDLSCLNDSRRAAQEAETYLLFTDVASPQTLYDLDLAVLGRTQGLLESVRTQKITTHMMGGLMNDAEQVLLKLVEGKRSLSF